MCLALLPKVSGFIAACCDILAWGTAQDDRSAASGPAALSDWPLQYVKDYKTRGLMP